jgi:hypothetical protein
MRFPGAVDVMGEAGSGARLAVMAEGLLEEGIDDLAKYRIILHLLQNPDAGGDTSYFATALGFHSPCRTAVLLNELVEAGLLSRQELPGGQPRYGLAPDSGLRGRLQRECRAAPDSPEYEFLLRCLAQRSVERAKAQITRAHKRRS